MPMLAGEMIPTTGTKIAPAIGREQGRGGVGDDLDVRGVVAEEPDPLFPVAHGDEQFAVARAPQLEGDRDDDQEDPGGDEVEHLLVDGIVEVVAEEVAEAAEPVEPAERLLSDEEDREGSGERLGEDREVGAFDAAFEDREAEEDRERGGEDEDRGDGEDR